MSITLHPNSTLINLNFNSYKYSPSQTIIKGAPLDENILYIENPVRYTKINKPNLLYCGKFLINKNFELIRVIVDKDNNLELEILNQLNNAKNLDKNSSVSITEVPSKNLLLLTFEEFDYGLQILNLNDNNNDQIIKLDRIEDYLPTDIESINNIEILSNVKTEGDNLIYFCIKLNCKFNTGVKATYLSICSINLVERDNELKIIYLLQGEGEGEILDFKFNSGSDDGSNGNEFTLISTNKIKLYWPKMEEKKENGNTNEFNNSKESDDIFNDINWYQTSEDLTIYIKLPYQINKDRLNCLLKMDSLELTYNSNKFTNEWFAPIIPSESYWTLENNQFLTLHLQKLNEKTKWPHKYLVDDNNLETLDPSELIGITEKLEKYTTNEEEVLPYQTNTLHDQFEEEEDEMERDSIFISIKKGGEQIISEFNREHSWLALPLPLVNQAITSSSSFSIALKHDVNGLIYNSNLNHVKTLPALGYIQSSKNQKKFTYYHPTTYNTIIVEYTQNLFIYYYPKEEDNGIQRVIKLNDSEEILGISGYLESNNLLLLTSSKLYLIEV